MRYAYRLPSTHRTSRSVNAGERYQTDAEPPSCAGTRVKNSSDIGGSAQTWEKKPATLRPVASSTAALNDSRIQSWNIVRIARTCPNSPLAIVIFSAHRVAPEVY